MPRIKHVAEADYKESFRSAKVAGMFDVRVEDKLRCEWDVDFPFDDEPWQVGLIVGASGSGKSTIAGQAFENTLHNGFGWESDCLLDDFDESLDAAEITDALSKVGFSSPPQWLLPYSALSTGQKFRAELARCLLEYPDRIVFDEFTSVVDRQVAKIASFAFQKAIRKTDKQFVAVTCHYDVEEWLQPDWVLDVSSGDFRRGSLRRPPITLEIFRCHHSIWRLFKGHHYLSADLNKAARVYVGFINDTPVVMTAVLHFPHATAKRLWKEHRTVVLPDYQGVGVGNKMSEAVGDLLIEDGKRFISTTSHPAMISYRSRSKKWRMTSKPGRNAKHQGKIMKGSSSANRLTASFEYLGNGNVDGAERSAARV